MTPTFASFIAAVIMSAQSEMLVNWCRDGLIQTLSGLRERDVESLSELGRLTGKLGETSTDRRRDGLNLGDPSLELDRLGHCLLQGITNLAHRANDELCHHNPSQGFPTHRPLVRLDACIFELHQLA